VVVEMRAVLRSVASGVALLALASNARASSGAAPRVVVVAQPPRDARLERALLLIRGELAGVGLSAEILDAEPESADVAEGSYGLVSLEEQGTVTRIRAFAPGDPKPIVTSVDAAEAGVDAEVIAVRAVETLRAAVLQFAQTHEAGLPDAVRGFAQLPKRAQAATHHDDGVPAQPTLRAPRPSAPTAQLYIGPELVWQPRFLPNLGAQGGFAMGPRWGFVAVGLESTLYDSDESARAGHVRVSRRLFSVQFGGRFAMTRAWEVTTRAGIGYASYGVSGKPEPGYVGVDLAHHSAVLSLAVGGAYYVARAIGVYLNVAGGVALDAPELRVAGEEVSTLDRPSLSISSGVLATVF
jgi:hypothetical protein